MRSYRVVLSAAVCALGAIAGCNDSNPDDREDARASRTAPAAETPLDTPEKLLRKVLALASNKRYEEVGELVLPLRLADVGPAPREPRPRDSARDVRGEILEGIRAAAATGEFAYSNKALLAVVTNHLDRFGRVPEEMLEEWAAGKGLGRDKAVQAAARAGGKDLLCFRRQGAFILLRKVRGEYRLQYWENLNAVLGESASRLAPPRAARRYHDIEPVTVKLAGDGKFVKAAASLVTDSRHAAAVEMLLRTRRQAVRNWLEGFLAGKRPADLADDAARKKLAAEVRAGINRLLSLRGKAQIESVVFRELTVR